MDQPGQPAPDKPEPGEIDLWVRHPVSRWVLAQLREAFPMEWHRAASWEATVRLQGRYEVLDVLSRLCRERD